MTMAANAKCILLWLIITIAVNLSQQVGTCVPIVLPHMNMKCSDIIENPQHYIEFEASTTSALDSQPLCNKLSEASACHWVTTTNTCDGTISYAQIRNVLKIVCTSKPTTTDRIFVDLEFAKSLKCSTDYQGPSIDGAALPCKYEIKDKYKRLFGARAAFVGGLRATSGPYESFECYDRGDINHKAVRYLSNEERAIQDLVTAYDLDHASSQVSDDFRGRIPFLRNSRTGAIIHGRRDQTGQQDLRRTVDRTMREIHHLVGTLKISSDFWHKPMSCTAFPVSPHHIMFAAHCVSHPIRFTGARDHGVLFGPVESFRYDELGGEFGVDEICVNVKWMMHSDVWMSEGDIAVARVTGTFDNYFSFGFNSDPYFKNDNSPLFSAYWKTAAARGPQVLLATPISFSHDNNAEQLHRLNQNNDMKYYSDKKMVSDRKLVDYTRKGDVGESGAPLFAWNNEEKKNVVYGVVSRGCTTTHDAPDRLKMHVGGQFKHTHFGNVFARITKPVFFVLLHHMGLNTHDLVTRERIMTQLTAIHPDFKVVFDTIGDTVDHSHDPNRFMEFVSRLSYVWPDGSDSRQYLHQLCRSYTIQGTAPMIEAQIDYYSENIQIIDELLGSSAFMNRIDTYMEWIQSKSKGDSEGQMGMFKLLARWSNRLPSSNAAVRMIDMKTKPFIRHIIGNLVETDDNVLSKIHYVDDYVQNYLMRLDQPRINPRTKQRYLREVRSLEEECDTNSNPEKAILKFYIKARLEAANAQPIESDDSAESTSRSASTSEAESTTRSRTSSTSESTSEAGSLTRSRTASSAHAVGNIEKIKKWLDMQDIRFYVFKSPQKIYKGYSDTLLNYLHEYLDDFTAVDYSNFGGISVSVSPHIIEWIRDCDSIIADSDQDELKHNAARTMSSWLQRQSTKFTVHTSITASYISGYNILRQESDENDAQMGYNHYYATNEEHLEPISAVVWIFFGLIILCVCIVCSVIGVMISLSIFGAFRQRMDYNKNQDIYSHSP
eukprot:227563_1